MQNLFSPISSSSDTIVNINNTIFRKIRNLEPHHLLRIIYIERIKRNLILNQPFEQQQQLFKIIKDLIK